MISRTIFDRKVVCMLAFTFVLVFVRMIYANDLKYVFLASNLVLAWIPFAVSVMLSYSKHLKPIYKIILFFTWLVFFPNAPYIITDFFHLKERAPVPYWYDIMLLFITAFNGVVLALMSIAQIDHFLTKLYGNKRSIRILVVCFFLCGFGIYLGRFLRWYSWDILLYPGDLISDVVHRFIYPWEHPRTWSITLLFGGFLSLAYFSLKNYFNVNKINN